MFLITIYRILKTSVISLWRNRWLSLAAILIMILTLFTITFFGSLLIVIDKATGALKEKVDISVYFNDEVSKDQIFALQNQLMTTQSNIKSIDYISKEKALERWRQNNQENEKVRDVITDTYNPLPRSLEVKTDKPENLEAVFQYLNNSEYKPLIREISYRKNKEIIDRLILITSFVKKIGWSLSFLFILISILIIYNTIRLTIYARSDEIEIMKLVGASDWYVQGPFFIEGMAYGLCAAIVSAIILFFTYELALPSAIDYLGAAEAQAMLSGLKFSYITLAQIGVGLLLGTSCSVYAVRKYLK